MNNSFLVPLSLLACFVHVQGQLSVGWFTDNVPTGSPSWSPSNSPTTSTEPSYKPSDYPSMIPSLAPTAHSSSAPSGLPSDFPSLVPSALPSYRIIPNNTPTDESLTPSGFPSIVPSDFPSTVPSVRPTNAPTGSPSFSIMPSSTPSQQPSGAPTSSPSVVPSSLPSMLPSTVPSSIPSDFPSVVPSFGPTGGPSAMPSISPSTEPSFSPTSSPSANPSPSPSAEPSVSPTAAPTSSPSVSPSTSPTAAPTTSPSSSPTATPSAAPTTRPSASPSVSPSTSPTEKCHDVATYRSPINNFSCSDHEGTVCTHWRFLGLSFNEVEELIDNCPVSCNVECGTSLRFETVYSFKLWNINTFLSPAAVSSMNEAAVDFFTDYVSNREPESTFFVYETVLLSQQFANNEPSRHLRSLQGRSASNSLLVDVEFRGYAIGLDKVTIDTRLRDGLFSPDYTLALQRSGDPTFKETQVGVIGGTRPNPTVAEESGRSSSPIGISAAILGSVAIVAGAGFYFFRTKKARGKNAAFMRENQEIFNNFPTSPNQSVLSPASSFSFDTASNIVSRMARIVTSFSPRSSNIDEEATKSAELTNSSSSESSKIVVDPVVDIITEGNRIEEGNEEEESDDEEAGDGVHPYTGIIPPMIVIDRIDSDSTCIYVEDSETSKKRVKSVVPSMRLDASSDLIAALNDRSKPFDPSTFSSFIESNTPVAEGEEGKVAMENLEIKGAGSSFNMFSSADADDDDDNSSKASNPDSSDALFDQLRKGEATDDPDEGSNTMARLDLRSRYPFNLGLLARPPRVPPSEGSGTNRSSPRSANTSPVITREKSTRSCDGYCSDDTAAKERVSKKDVAPSFLHSLWSKSPHNRNHTSGAKSDTSGESNKRWRPSHKRNSSKGSYGTLGSLEGEGSVLTFHAPKGQLGLVIECSSETAPVIASVKDYSPLLDQVLPGDKIVMIDSTATDKMGMSEVMSLLEGKSSRATSVRLKVFRANDGLDGTIASQVRSPTVSHLSFDGTGSLGTMSDHESPIGHKLSSHSLAPLPHQPANAAIKRSHSEAEIQRNME